MQAYLNFLRTKTADDIPLKSKVMKYMHRNYSLCANETTTDNANPSGFLTGSYAKSCTTTAIGMYHFICNRYASNEDAKSLDKICESHTGKDFKIGLPTTIQALQELGPTLFLFYTEAHKFCILRANQDEACILHSNQDESRIPYEYLRSGAKFSFPDYLNPELFLPCFIMDDEFVFEESRVQNVPSYTSELTLSETERSEATTELTSVETGGSAPALCASTESPTHEERNPIPRIRRFIQFRGDAELIQFFADIEQSRNEAYCQSIYERYFGIPFKYDKINPHWFIAAPILPLTADEAA